MKKISWEEFRKAVAGLHKSIDAKLFDETKYDGIYGIPRGGEYVAKELSKISKLPIVKKENISRTTIIVDDVCESGKTIKEFVDKGYAVYVLHIKPKAEVEPYYYWEEVNEWIVYPWETDNDNETIERNIERIAQFYGIKMDIKKIKKILDMFFDITKNEK